MFEKILQLVNEKNSVYVNLNPERINIIEKLRSIGADGGVIVLDSEGNVAMTFNTPAMARAYKNSKGEQLVKIYRD